MAANTQGERNARLKSYSMMFAGVAGAVATQQAGAAIVYSGPKNITATVGTPALLDIEGDGFDDYQVTVGAFAGTPLISIAGAPGPGTPGPDYYGYAFIVPTNGYPYAQRFALGEAIPAANASGIQASDTATILYGTFGPFKPTNDSGYIGIIFADFALDTPAFVSGWIHLSAITGTSITIDDWAFQDDPTLGLQAGAVPEPASLGALAVGAAALLRNPRRKVARDRAVA